MCSQTGSFLGQYTNFWLAGPCNFSNFSNQLEKMDDKDTTQVWTLPGKTEDESPGAKLDFSASWFLAFNKQS